jgi:hypothetical protein
MRAVWIIFWLLALLPPLFFAGLHLAGLTENLQFISTTMWEPGNPSAWQLTGAGASLIAWISSKAFSPIFLLAGMAFFICDLRRAIQERA